MNGLVSVFVFYIFGLVTSNINNGTQPRTWKYLGYYFSKYKVKEVSVVSPTANTASTPTQQPPLYFIPPQDLPIANPPLALPDNTIPSGSIPVQDFFLPVVPPQALPVSTPFETFVPPQPFPSDNNITNFPEPYPTISTDTALFPTFDDLETDPIPVRPTFPTLDSTPFMFVPAEPSSALPLPTDLTNGVTPNFVALAQNFPQPVFPQPAATDPTVQTTCSCVLAGTCVTVRGLGSSVNVRIVTQSPGITCPAGQQYCCTQITNQPQVTNCGIQSIRAGVTPGAGQANFGEFPWSGIILTTTNQYLGGAALITTTHLLTAAHLVASYGNGVGLKVRLGDWDLSGTYEPDASVEIAVLNVVTHPSYVASTLQNDLAVITLATPVAVLTAPSPQVNTVCLPAATDVFTGSTCLVAGWGRDSWGGNYQNILKKVEVPVLGSVDCQSRLQQTKLGPNWNLDTTSFICAGGEISKDACQGDGGNALVCLRNGLYVVAGITAGGVECGLQGVPGLYVNTASYLQWIAQETQTATLPVGSIDPRRIRG